MMILPDNETRVDLLNNEAIAATIIKLLRDQRAQPVTVGVHGDWGVGKSSILEMIEAGLADTDDVLCLKFNGWRFQGFEDAKIALIEGIVTGLLEKRPLLNKTGTAVKDLFKCIDWLKVAKHAGGLALTAFTGIPTPEQIQAITDGLQNMLADPTKLATKENLTAAIDGIQSVLRPAEPKHVPEEITEFRKAFDKLLRDAGVKQLIVLVDDLDRCLPDTAIETLEAIRLFVFTSGTAFVVAADEAMIEYSVRKHFPELPDATGPRDYARNYLEKLIQVPFRIPALGETETRIYVTLLLVGAKLGDGDPDYGKLIAVARERLKRPWESAPLDLPAIKTALGNKATSAQNAVTLSDQIGPILASDREAGIANLDRAIEVAQRQNSRFLELRATVSKARLWLERGRLDEARAMLTPVYR
jgi:predicted KAP-like P-loop ATPase